MKIKVLIDMNLSPDWVPLFRKIGGWEAVHWSSVGDPKATDRAIMDWADTNGHVVLTHDLDFGALLAFTRKGRPSVVLVRGQDILPDRMGERVIAAMGQYKADLESGALIVVEANKNRVRILPI